MRTGGGGASRGLLAVASGMDAEDDDVRAEAIVQLAKESEDLQVRMQALELSVLLLFIVLVAIVYFEFK